MLLRLAENFRAVFYAPFYATQALGLFAAEGVQLQLLDSPAPGAATPLPETRHVAAGIGTVEAAGAACTA